MEPNRTTRVTDIICPNCGDNYLTWNGSRILTSNPPQYEYYCEGCGFSHIAYSDSAMMDWIERLDAPVKNTVPEDNVNHPSHYETGKFECFDVMREAFGDMAVQNFCVCNAFKYLYRHTRKNGVEDISKAKWYIDKFLEIVDEGATNE